MLDRHALTMRNLAFAAILVLLFQPEALLGAALSRKHTKGPIALA